VALLATGRDQQQKQAGVTRIFSEKISTRATNRAELEGAVALAREMRASGVAVTLVVYEHKRLRSGLDLAGLAEELKTADIGLEFLTGELQGSHDPSGIVFTVCPRGAVGDGTRVHPRPHPGRPTSPLGLEARPSAVPA
jgi:hypothetical protein